MFLLPGWSYNVVDKMLHKDSNLTRDFLPSPLPTYGCCVVQCRERWREKEHYGWWGLWLIRRRIEEEEEEKVEVLLVFTPFELSFLLASEPNQKKFKTAKPSCVVLMPFPQSYTLVLVLILLSSQDSKLLTKNFD